MSNREAILEAAIRVGQREGVLAMTLDKVALEANISKGGLVYHFPSKDVLLKELILYFGQEALVSLMQKVAVDRAPGGRWIRALVNTIEPQTREDALPFESEATPSEISKFYTSLLAAVAMNPVALAPLADTGRTIRDHIISEGEGDLGDLLVWLALDGLFVWELFGLISREDPMREQIVELIRRHARIAPGMVPETSSAHETVPTARESAPYE